MLPIDEIVVTDIAGDQARVHAAKLAHKDELVRIGFIGQADELARPIRDVQDRIQLVVKLIELGALFSSGRDWSPEELVQYYVEQGSVSGPYRVISWSSSERCAISTQ